MSDDDLERLKAAIIERGGCCTSAESFIPGLVDGVLQLRRGPGQTWLVQQLHEMTEARNKQMHESILAAGVDARRAIAER